MAGVWSREEKDLHISILEMKALILALNAFLDKVTVELVVLMSNVTVIAYLRKQWGTVLRVVCDLAHEVVLWTEILSVNLKARYIP